MNASTPKESDTISTEESYILSNDQASSRCDPTISMLVNQISCNVTRKIKEKNQNNQEAISRKWSGKETQYFYKLLEIFGTDFTMMANHQHRRTKKELLNKYKKEYIKNPKHIKRLISNQESSTYLNVQ